MSGLDDDVYGPSLLRALECVGIAPGWRVADVGAGTGDVSLFLAEMTGPAGRVFAVDANAEALKDIAFLRPEIVSLAQRAEELSIEEQLDLVVCRFLLLHVSDPQEAIERMAGALRAGGYLVAAEPITSAGRVGGLPLSMPSALHPDVGAILPALVRGAGLELVDAWAEAPVGAGRGPVSSYLERLTDVDPGDDPVVLPPLVTTIGRRRP